jgi:hypothetical protein
MYLLFTFQNEKSAVNVSFVTADLTIFAVPPFLTEKILFYAEKIVENKK